MLSKEWHHTSEDAPGFVTTFVPAVARLRLLRLSPGAVLNIVPFITALLGVVR